jgi:4-methyl-5(b-hydroxyethyl)-thiazole monophosphate biosynthesis
MQKKVLAVIADGFEEVEAVTPIDLLRRAGIKVTVAGLDDLQITGAHGITIVADVKFNAVNEHFDALVLHGGNPGAQNLAASSELKTAIASFFNGGKIVAAICASPALVLAPAGILKEKKACCFPGLEGNFEPSTKVSYEPVVVDGNVITSRGVGTAHAFGLAIIESLSGKEIKDKIAKATLFEE